MPDLTRRPDPDRPDSWHIYFGDVQVGSIGRTVGLPNAQEKWKWSCGFYPGSRPGEVRQGTEDDFETARQAFAAAWEVFKAGRTEADYQEWRDQRDWTARKYALHDKGKQVPIR